MINKKYPSHLNKLALFSIFILFLSSSNSMAKPQNKSTTFVNVGVVLHDLHHSVGGKIWLSCIEMALYDFYVSRPQYNTRLVLKIREYKQNSVLGAANAALYLIKNELVQAIIGPVTSLETSFVISLGDKAHVPIISFSATSPSLTSLQSSYYFQFAQNDATQVNAISAIIETFGWREVGLIYADSVFDDGMIPFLTDALQQVDARVPYRSKISPSATDDQIEGELYNLMAKQTRVFIVHMTNDLCTKLFAKAEEIRMTSEGYVWLITSGITNRLSSMNSSVIKSMNGFIGVQPYIPETTELGEFKLRWKKQFRKDYPTIDTPVLDVFGLWAYDGTHALALAIEQVYVGTTDFGFQNTNASNSSIPISPHGPKLCEALSTVTFQGMAGNFSLVDGQLQSSTCEIININGREARTIGFWSPESRSDLSNLGPIIWPGETLSIPKGWDVRPKFVIGVPVEDGFNEFLSITRDPRSGKTDITGFSIEVFRAVLKVLPYDVSHQFIPFAKPDSADVGNYSNIIYQVVRGNFDAVAGAITVVADYSFLVDFTVPYAASGIVMVVPIQDIRSKDTWAFLKPWKGDLWLAMAGFFVLIGFVVWVLEHRVNKDFRGPPSHQLGFGLWFSFSTMVSAQTGTIASNLTRFVVGIWMFVVIVLTINYTASLTSLYTIQKLQPTITDLKGLLRNGENVGYLNNVYVRGLLQQTGFDNSMLKSFRTLEAIDEAFSKGKEDGGISAVVDEILNMKLFLAKYCNKYMMIGPIFQTNGFAFVLQKQSPILPDISQGIQALTKEGKIQNLENKWFKTESKCQEGPTTKDSGDGRGLGSFWVLFLIAGLASVIALIIFVVSFIYRHMHVFKQPANSRHSTWTKIQIMFKIFNEKDPNCEAFKCSQPDTVEASPNHPQSPVGDNSSDIDTNYAFSGEQHTSSTDQASPEITPAATDVVVTIQEMQISTPITAQVNN